MPCTIILANSGDILAQEELLDNDPANYGEAYDLVWPLLKKIGQDVKRDYHIDWIVMGDNYCYVGKI